MTRDPINNNEARDAILASLAAIPYGKVSSYGKIAAASGHPGKARYVAYLLKNLPSGTDIPWHRVINSQGKISFKKESDKYRQQLERLTNEGIPMPLSPKSLKTYIWPNGHTV